MLVFISFILSIVSSTYIDVQTKCTCEELLTEGDCKVGKWKGLCSWDENKCIEIEFCQILSYDADYCAGDKRCAYLEGKCTKFTSCDQYVGDKSACQAISNQCTSQDGETCENKVIPSCSDYNEDDCGHKIAKDGECGFINNKCQVLKSCSDFNLISGFDWLPKEKCKYHLTACEFSNETCIPKKCNNVINNVCSYVHDYNPFDLYSIDPQSLQLCKWEDSHCVEAMPKDLAQYNCYINTRFSYFWNPNSNSCQKCKGPLDPDNFGDIMKVIIVMFLFSQ